MGSSRALLLAALAFLPGASGAQTTAPKEPVAAAAPGGAAALARVDRYLQAELTRQRIPGMSVAVVRKGRVVLSRGYGYANLEHRVPATDSTVYQSGSVAKQFTAALVTMLAEEGRLGLDDPVRRHLPEGPPSWDSITVRHLLTHTSGIPDYTEGTIDYRRDYSEEELLRMATTLPVEFAPGARWSYSNTGYLLLGIIVRRVTGRFYGDVLHERLLRPLGMSATRIITERELVPNRSAGYQLVDGRLEHQDWVAPSLNISADGSLYLTVRDLARWALALDSARIPSAAVLRQSWTPVRLASGGTYPYGFGWDLAEHRGRRRIGHGGSWQGFRASIQRFPEFDLTVIVLANLAEAQPESISLAVAGLMEPALQPAHVVRAGSRGPRQPVPRLLAAVGRDDTSAAVMPQLRSFLSADLRESLARLAAVGSWTDAGCDELDEPRPERLGVPISRICYARALEPARRRLVEVSYSADWRAVMVDWYDY